MRGRISHFWRAGREIKDGLKSTSILIDLEEWKEFQIDSWWKERSRWRMNWCMKFGKYKMWKRRNDDFAVCLQYVLKWAAVLNGLLSEEWIGKNCILVCI